jgi:aspartate aminotransferase-like enzyme
VVDYLLEHHNIKIAGGLGKLKNKIIRIGYMSPSTSEADIDEVLDALSDHMRFSKS